MTNMYARSVLKNRMTRTTTTKKVKSCYFCSSKKNVKYEAMTLKDIDDKGTGAFCDICEDCESDYCMNGFTDKEGIEWVVVHGVPDVNEKRKPDETTKFLNTLAAAAMAANKKEEEEKRND